MRRCPPDCVALFSKTDSARCAVQLQPAVQDECMPFDEPQQVIDGIHDVLEDNQGLIEVKAASQERGRFIYSIVKSQSEPSGMLYILTADLAVRSGYVRLQGWFSEVDTTGMRDNMVFAMKLKGAAQDFDRIRSGWTQDPYDKDYTRGALMNASEAECYDELFPSHPLSVTRRFVAQIIEGNLV